MNIPTWDIESLDWDYPVSVGFYDGQKYHEFLRESDGDDIIWRFLQFLRSYEGLHLYAHYASRYDNLFVLKTLCDKDEPIELEAGLAKVRWCGPNIHFEDSSLLAPMKLNKLAKMVGVNEKEQWDHSETVPPWEMDGDNLQRFRAYQKADCIILSQAMGKLSEAIRKNLGVPPSISIATTAVKAFSRHFYNLANVESNEELEQFIRAAMYGGRNEVYYRYGENIHHFDVHDMYISCYDVPIPIGKLRWKKANLDTATIAEATVKVPADLYIGPLPYHSERRLLFPVGEFTGWWDGRELRNAVEKFNVDATIHRQLETDEVPILEEFGKFAHGLRADPTTSRYWKVFGIAPSGKLGQSRWRDVIKHVSEIRSFQGAAPVDRSEHYFRTTEYIRGRAPYIKPTVAMRIRAEARIRHLDYLMEALDHGRIYYADTDSVFCDHHFPAIKHPGAGELSYLGEALRAYFIRQKLYGFVMDGEIVQRSAGYSDIELTEEDFQTLLQNGKVEVLTGNMPNYMHILTGGELKHRQSRRQISAAMMPNRVEHGNDTAPIQLTS